MLRLAADENIHSAIVRGLQRRSPTLDITRLQEVIAEGTPDPQVLDWAASENRVLISNDRSTMIGFAYQRATEGKPIVGVIATVNSQSIGSTIEDIY